MKESSRASLYVQCRSGTLGTDTTTYPDMFSYKSANISRKPTRKHRAMKGVMKASLFNSSAACRFQGRAQTNGVISSFILELDQATAQFLFCLLITFPVLCLYHVAYLAVLWWGDKKNYYSTIWQSSIFRAKKMMQ